MTTKFAKWAYLNPENETNPDLMYEFTVLERMALPLLPDSEDGVLSRETIFLENATVKGVPVSAEIVLPSMSAPQKGEGVLIREPGGFYILPKKKVRFVGEASRPSATTSESPTPAVTASNVEKPDSLAKRLNSVQVFGFTGTQLLVIAAVTFVTYKIAR